MQVEHTQFFSILNTSTKHILFKIVSLVEKISLQNYRNLAKI